jgi:hypothetical protein
MHTSELRMGDVKNQIERNRMRWFGHAKRMDEHRIPKRLLEMKMTGKKTQGQTTNMVARPSQQSHTKKTILILEEG